MELERRFKLAAKSIKNGWTQMSLGQKVYLGNAALFGFSNIGALVSTDIAFNNYAGSFEERNPLMRHILENFGMGAVYTTKISAMFISIGVSEVVRYAEEKLYGSKYLNGFAGANAFLGANNLVSTTDMILNVIALQS